MTQKVSVVTVVYEDEIELLSVQARSFSKYLQPELAEEIIVIINGDHRVRTAKAVECNVLPLYGALRDLVHVFDAGEIAVVPKGFSGWHTQQVLKLSVADHVSTPYILVFDAKNHLVAGMSRDDIFNDDNQLFYSQTSNRSIEEHFKNSMAYFGVTDDADIDRSFPTFTPLTLLRDKVLDLRRYLKQEHNTDFATLLLQYEVPYTEFMIYYGYLLAMGEFERHYVPGPSIVATVWQTHAENAEAFEDLIDRAQAGRSKVFSIHRLAIPILSESQLSDIVDLWLAKGIFQSAGDAWQVFGQYGEAGARRAVEGEGKSTVASRPVARLKRNEVLLSRPFLTLACEVMSRKLGGNVVFVQVGGNDGSTADPIHFWVKGSGWSGIILEPVKSYYGQLCAYWASYPFVKCINLAVDRVVGTKEIFRVSDAAVERQYEREGERYLQGIASFNKDHLFDHNVNEADIIIEEVKTAPLSEILKENHVNRANLLVVDVEGAERVVLETLDFSFLHCDAIVFEGTNMTRADEAALTKLLEKNNYRVITAHPDYIAISMSGLLSELSAFFDAVFQDWFETEMPPGNGG